MAKRAPAEPEGRAAAEEVSAAADAAVPLVLQQEIREINKMMAVLAAEATAEQAETAQASTSEKAEEQMRAELELKGMVAEPITTKEARVRPEKTPAQGDMRQLREMMSELMAWQQQAARPVVGNGLMEPPGETARLVEELRQAMVCAEERAAREARAAPLCPTLHAPRNPSAVT